MTQSWTDNFLNGDLPIRSENPNPDLSAIDAIIDNGLKMAYMALNNSVSKTGDIKKDLSSEKLEAFTKEYCKPNSLLDCITFEEITP